MSRRLFSAQLRPLNQRWLVLAGALLLAACSGDPQTVELTPSPADSRSYRAFTLANGLSAIVISDPSADKAAASLDVAVGNYSSPRGREGLPHFLEHMLFLGTDKYPEVNSYGEFIDQRGGSKNAYTSHRNTNYYFDINADHLEPALDRFSRFFIAPRFAPEYVERERNAVYSEYQLHLKNDPWRQRYVLRELANPEHPYSLFMVGDLSTLREQPLVAGGPTLREELLSFYRRYYIAEQMKLVVGGRESLDELEAMVRDKFAEVPAGQRVASPEQGPLFTPGTLPAEVHFRPEADLRELSIIYSLPSSEAHWQQKPINFLASLVGSEASGSLLDVLRRAGWVNALSAGSALSDASATLFVVNLELTPAGLENRKVIVPLVQHWLDLIAADPELARRYQEQASLLQQAFQFEQQGALVDRVTRLADTMQRLPLARVLDGPYLMSGWDAALIKRYTEALNADNRLVMVTAKELAVDRKAAYFESEYRLLGAPTEQPLGFGGSALAAELRLPPANPFIAENTQLLASAEVANSAGAVPQRLSAAPIETWHLATTRFNVPHGQIILQLQHESAQSQLATVYSELLMRYLRDQINDQLYPALQAGLNFALQRDGRGWRLVVGGYADKQPLVLTALLDALETEQWDRSRFERIRQSYLEDISNAKNEFPFRQLLSLLSVAVEGGWLPQEQAAIAAQVELPALAEWTRQARQQWLPRLMVTGNFSSQQALSFAEEIAQRYPYRGAAGHFEVAQLAHQPQRSEYWVPGNNQAAVLYLPAGADTLEARAINLLVAEWLGNPFYTELRTQRQLGYVVAAVPRNFYRQPGIAMVVQSPDFSLDEITAAVDEFVAAQPSRAQSLNNQQLEQLKASVVGRVTEQPKNLAELNGQWVESLLYGYHSFDFRQQVAAAVAAVSLEQLSAAIDTLAVQSQRWWLLASPQIDPELNPHVRPETAQPRRYPL